MKVNIYDCKPNRTMTDKELSERLDQMEKNIKARVSNETNNHGFSWIAFGMLAYLFFHACNQ